MWFGPGREWGWQTAAWQPSIYYRAPLYRSAPIWVRPAPVVVGARIFVPPYKDVIHGGYHYLAYRNGGFVREAPRTGIVLPPKHEFHPIAPEAEARMHVGAQARASGVASQVQNAGSGGARPQASTPARSSPWTNYHPTPPAATGVPNNNGSRPGTVSAVGEGSQGRSYPQTADRPTPQTTTQPRSVRESEPRQEYHAPAPAPRQETRAPQPTAQQKPSTQQKSTTEPKKPN
jgi:hypothetical protein